MKPVGPFAAVGAAAEELGIEFPIVQGMEPSEQLFLVPLLFGFLVLIIPAFPSVFPLFAGQADAGGVVVFAAQAMEFVQEVFHLQPALFGIFDGIKLLDGGEQLNRKQRRDAVGDGAVAGVFFKVAGLFPQCFDLLATFLKAKPGLVAAACPFVEVLLGNRGGIELPGENVFAKRIFVEPFENVGGRMAVQEAAIEFLTGVIGEAGDFAVTSHKTINELMG